MLSVMHPFPLLAAFDAMSPILESDFEPVVDAADQAEN